MNQHTKTIIRSDLDTELLLFQAQSDHTYRYDEYGKILPEDEPGWTAPHNQYTLTQKQYDAHMDLYYFGARHYDPFSGTWMTQDIYKDRKIKGN